MKSLSGLLAACVAALISSCVQSGDLEEARGATIATMQCGRVWRQIEVHGPGPRVFSSVTETPFGVALFGGFGRAGVLGEGWLWDGVRWQQLPEVGAPTARAGHIAVWTGHALCVWGGEVDGSPLGDGACWTPGDSAWRPMRNDGAPSPRAHAGACFAGGEVVLYGGQDSEGEAFADGAAWNPSTGTWRSLSSVGAPRARAHALLAPLDVGSDQRVLVWGGNGDALALGAEDAALYDPARDVWTSIDLTDAPTASSGPLSATLSTGIWALNRDGVRVFDAVTMRWRAERNDPAMGPRFGATPVSLPGGVWLWGGRDEQSLLGDGGCYDTTEERWTLAPTEGAPSPRTNTITFWDGARLMVLWGEDESGLRDDAYALER